MMTHAFLLQESMSRHDNRLQHLQHNSHLEP